MKREYHIRFDRGYERMLQQYRVMYKQLGNIRYLPRHENSGGMVYDIKPELGSGTISVYRLLGNVMLSIYDYVYYEDVVTEFDLTEGYFEIEYCVAGGMSIEEERAGRTCFEPNQLSLSLSRSMRGRVRHGAGQKYQGISITADKGAMSAYFGSMGKEAWQETIESLESKLRCQYYLGRNASPELTDIFLQIYGCRLPAGFRNLFYESKVMEALSFLMSDEVMKREGIKLMGLTPYELQKIKEIPQLLMDQLFELPSLPYLSKKLAINPKKLSSCFKLVYGDTIFSYHRALAIRRAAVMLLNTDKTISEIAYDSGYSNPSSFCAAFKRRYSISPLKYREASSLRK